MSGHSKWHSIKHKKGAADAARGKVFTKHAKLIQICARAGGDPDMNPSLRVAIDNAKTDNVPNANIERAIKKGSGDLKDGNVIEEIVYEGYGPGGTAMLVNCLSDNRNRTVSNVKSAFNKNGGRMGESGSVAWMFDRKGVIEISLEGKDPDELELMAIDAGAEDIEEGDGIMTIICSADNYLNVKDKLEKDGLQILRTKIDQIPQNVVKVSDEETAKKIIRLMEAIEEDDDVDTVSSNFDIDEGIMENLV